MKPILLAACFFFPLVASAHVERDGWKVAGLVESELVNPGGVPRGLRADLVKDFFGTGLLSASGQPFTHEQQQQRITFTPGMWQGGGWNLMANPYPSDIDWNLIRPDNDTSKLTQFIAIWSSDSASYGQYDGLTHNSIRGVTNKIASMQSFFVLAKTSAGLLSNPSPSYLTINESHKLGTFGDSTERFLKTRKVAKPNPMMQNHPNQMMISTFSSPRQGSDGCFLRFVPGGVIYFDNTEDSPKLPGTVNFTTLSSDFTSCFTNTYPLLEGRFEVFCRLNAPTNTTYTIRVDSLESFPVGCRFFLKDRGALAGRDSIQDLEVSNVYSFLYTGAASVDVDDRFTLICYSDLVETKPMMPGRAASPLGAYLFPNPASSLLTVKLSNSSGKASYRVISSTRAQAMAGKAEGSSFILDVQELPKGIYLIRVEECGRSVTRRFVKE